MKPKAIVYARYSSDIQKKGDSIDRQTGSVDDIAERLQVDIKEIIIDKGVSSFRGQNIRRGNFQQVWDRIEDGTLQEGDFLIVESVDRISRQEIIKTTQEIYKILEKGIRIHTTTDNRTYDIKGRDAGSRSEGFLNYVGLGVRAERANEESEVKSIRRKSAWKKQRQLAKQGVIFNRHHNTPYGYRLVELEGERHFAIQEDEADEIREIFRLLKSTGMSSACQIINQKSKRKWQPRRVASMLESQYPTGTLRTTITSADGKPVRGEFIENYYPRIVDETDFQEAKIAVDKRRNDKAYQGRKSSRNLNILSNVVKCGLCGSGMTFVSNKVKGITYYYYECGKKRFDNSCTARVRADYAYLLVIELMQKGVSGIYEGTIGELIEKQFGTDIEKHNEEIESFQKSFTMLLTTKKRAKKSREIFDTQNKVAELDRTLSNYKTRLKDLKGEVPQMFVEAVMEAETERKQALEALTQLQVEQEKEGLGIESEQDLLQFIQEESKRLKLNAFFRDNDISFVLWNDIDHMLKNFKENWHPDNNSYDDCDILGEVKHFYPRLNLESKTRNELVDLMHQHWVKEKRKHYKAVSAELKFGDKKMSFAHRVCTNGILKEKFGIDLNEI
ncbi:recombinase family protein [Salinicola aestuarinus]|uniref:recombinase family protein n=1 Tax=Salinicola aestuarinus TaxID=1949082 RepID=UPI000DA20A25|nr:recombinase family protein [Salinicola aestuarinus]